MDGGTAENPFSEGFYDLVLALDGSRDKSPECSAVFFVDDHIVRYVHKTAGKITRIGSLEGGIRKTFTCTVRRDEVLEHGHAFLQVRYDRVLDDLGTLCSGFLRFCHKSSHTAQLFDLLCRSTGS